MGNELVTINNTSIQEGGLGVNFSSKLFQVKPATLTIVQSNTTTEGAIKGHLRVSETGDQFEEMWATLLVLPTEQRQYHIGDPSEMNRIPENLMCFSTDMVHPNDRARVPQAMNCANCPRSDWGPWREYKEQNDGRTSKALIPPCDASYKAMLMDSKYKLPMNMYIRSKAREPFEEGMGNVARLITMAKAEGKNPNIFDVIFRIRTKLVTQGKFTFYVPVFDKFRWVTEEERQQFGAVYLRYTESIQKREQEAVAAQAEAEVTTTQGNIDSSVSEGEYVDGEIVI